MINAKCAKDIQCGNSLIKKKKNAEKLGNGKSFIKDRHAISGYYYAKNSIRSAIASN